MMSLYLLRLMAKLLKKREVIEDIEFEVLEKPLLEGNNEKSTN